MNDHAAPGAGPPGDGASARPGAPVDADRSRRTSRRSRITALIVACALFMQNLDSTVIATALPTIARAFGAEPVHMNVALTAYLLSLAVFIPASGWIADRFGAKHVFRLAIIVFTVGSVLCGQSDSLGELVAARVFQGMGGAMMVPVGRLVLLRTVPKHELVAAMAWLSTPALLGPVLGPPVGGFIVDYFSWRTIFEINIPMGILGVVLVTLYVDDIREPAGTPFDWRGFLLSGTALASLMLGLETIGRGIFEAWISWAAIATGVAAGLLYFWHARIHAAPLIDFGLLKYRTFLVAVAGGTLFRIGIGAIPFLLPMMLQLTFGKSATESGLITFASSLGALAMKPAATGALRWLGFRDTLLVNGVVSSVLLGMVAFFQPGWPIVLIYAILLAGGFFRSLQFTAYNALAYADIPRAKMGFATGFYATVQQVSMTLGVSVGAASLTVTMALSGVAEPRLMDFATAFLLVASVSLCSLPVSLLLARDAGQDMSGHVRRG
jgi:EmrB/QacA subfamily drug resistance transporter